MSAQTNDESFGIRDIKFLFSNSTTTVPTCAHVPVTSYFLQNCSCPRGMYNNGSSSVVCASCHPNCVSCFGGSENDCYECKQGNYFDGDGCKNCHSSCSSCSGPTLDECTECYLGYVLYENKCILSTRCVSPFIISPCDNTCSPTHCNIIDKGSWGENCFPPCPVGGISDFEGFCHGNFFL